MPALAILPSGSSSNTSPDGTSSTTESKDEWHVHSRDVHRAFLENVPLEERPSNGDSIIDPVFGEIREGDTNYRVTGWKRAAFLMMKTQVGIGSLSIPAAFETLGLIPGVLVLTIVAILATWSNHTAGNFSIRHPEVFSLDQAGKKMYGRLGEYVFLTCLMLYYVFTAGSALVSVSTCFNALSDHGACTAVFIAVAAVIALGLGSVKKIDKISMFAPIAVTCILASLFTVSIAVSLQRPAKAPAAPNPWKSDYKLFNDPTFPQAMAAVSTIIFSFTGTPYFFTIITEMRSKEDYFKSMYVCQAVVYSVYLIIGVMVYYFCGSYVTSPALGSAGLLIKKVAYGFALPGLLITAMIVCHVPAKTIFLRVTPLEHRSSKTWQHWTIWLSCTSGVVLTAYIIASAIPGFGSLVSLVGALFGTLIVLQPYGLMWWYDATRKYARSNRNRRWYMMAVWATFVIVVGCFCTICGTWGALQNIITEYTKSVGKIWSCADNSTLD